MHKMKTSTFHETLVERYENPDFSTLILETTSKTSVSESGVETKSSSRRVRPDLNSRHTDYCKALVLALARYGALMELPYTIEGVSGGAVFDDADAAHWYAALTDDNPPGKVSFRLGKERYTAFRELVVPLDFRVYDAPKAEEIRELYRLGSTTKVSTVDADLIIQGELGELDEK